MHSFRHIHDKQGRGVRTSCSKSARRYDNEGVTNGPKTKEHGMRLSALSDDDIVKIRPSLQGLRSCLFQKELPPKPANSTAVLFYRGPPCLSLLGSEAPELRRSI